MSGHISRYSIVAVFISSLSLIGCGSDGEESAGATAPVYAGNTMPAAINSSNASTLSTKSTEGVNEAINVETAGDGIPFAVSINSGSSDLAYNISNIAGDLATNLNAANLPSGLVLSATELNNQIGGSDFCGGTVTVPDNFNPASGLNLTMTFNALCYNDGTTQLTMTGALVFTETASTITVQFTNFNVIFPTASGTANETFNATISCDTSFINCSLSTDFVGLDGVTYRLSNVSVTGTAASGYTVSATFFHATHGSVSISTNVAISYGTCGIYPDNGEIVLTGGSGAITVTFNGDCTYSVNGFDGGSNPITLANISWP